MFSLPKGRNLTGTSSRASPFMDCTHSKVFYVRQCVSNKNVSCEGTVWIPDRIRVCVCVPPKGAEMDQFLLLSATLQLLVTTTVNIFNKRCHKPLV